MKNRIMALIEVIGPVYREEIGLLLYSGAKGQMEGTWEAIGGINLL